MAYSVDCPNGHNIKFDKHPADWPNHPAGLRVKVECPICGGTAYTEGEVEAEVVKRAIAEKEAELRAEVAARLGEEQVVAVAADEAGGGADQA